MDTTVVDALCDPPVLTVTHTAKPWTHNDEAREHRMAGARRTAQWRADFARLARQVRRVPLPTPVVVVVHVERRDRRGRLDVAAPAPTVKAAIDGLVDAGLLPDDDPDRVAAIVFIPADVTGRDAITLRIHAAGTARRSQR